MTTYLAWEGPSMIDGTPIALLVSTGGGSNPNRKTGDMVQTYILRADLRPAEAYKAGLDVAICGDCPFRSKYSGGNGACYVNVAQGPTSVFGAYQRGNAQEFDLRIVRNRNLRVGSYGDPAAIPFEVWAPILERTRNNTGYTRQWNKPWAQDFKKYCMASVQNLKEKELARSMGWRSFFVVPRGHDVGKLRSTIHCPAADQKDPKALQCFECMQCNGERQGRTVDVVIAAHGSRAKAHQW